MLEKMLISIDRIPDNLLSSLENRDVALWVLSLPKEPPNHTTHAAFLSLPWRLVLTESNDPQLIRALEVATTVNDPMTRRRGFVQIVDTDPSRIELPRRCLPVYLLNGRYNAVSSSEFDNRLRRMTMLEELRRSGAREVLVVSADGDPVPPELEDLWSSGFRAHLIFVSDATDADKLLAGWLETSKGVATLLRQSVSQVITDVLARYAATYPEDRRIIRVRDTQGVFHKIDVTESDEPERPILESYALIEERDLNSLVPEEISEDEFVTFFRDTTASWRPYAAKLPWIRDPQCGKKLFGYLKKLDTAGTEANCIAYISSESGAGGTTLARALAWECAREGYPVLLARPMPFIPDPLPVRNFLNRVLNAVEGQSQRDSEAATRSQSRERDSVNRHYEAPWVIVFDSLHWEDRDGELAHFRNEMEKAGRPVCVLVVTGPMLGISFIMNPAFKKIAELNHSIELEQARQLGIHLNQFLRVYGKQREQRQWDRFYGEHTIRYLDGIAAFWVTLSFWIQGQYDLSESIQHWMYRSFKEKVTDRTMQEAILRIAALSSERLPLPDVLLPSSKGKWPTSLLLGDARSNLAALGLVRISSDGEKYWALVHDILGRFLINALFYDFPLREELGFGAAKDPEYLRYLLLREISKQPALGERAYRSLGEDFATSIFKIDPDHGHGRFVSIWREVLGALDQMPRSLRDTSRLFRHHTAVSRRRIAKLDEVVYGVTNDERIQLLNSAIDDINYALTFIDFTPGSESNINLLNSLANAYFDLAEAEFVKGSPRERITELRRLANETTRRAYAENPTNSFVIETYVKNLLHGAKESPEHAVEQCVEALGILFSALTTNEVAYRAFQLGNLSGQALAILFQQTPPITEKVEPRSPIDVLVQAWKTLAQDGNTPGIGLSEVSESNRARALDVLAHPAGRGNMQVIRLSYDLTCINQPYEFKKQLELVEQLYATDSRLTPQLRLEYAILLFQAGRALEGDKEFRQLRQLWRDSEILVQIPERLRWLHASDGEAVLSVQALTVSDYGNRAMARVQALGALVIPFRPEELGIRDLRVGMRFACHVSFGHNGPFLRPVTAGPAEGSRGGRG